MALVWLLFFFFYFFSTQTHLTSASIYPMRCDAMPCSLHVFGDMVPVLLPVHSSSISFSFSNERFFWTGHLLLLAILQCCGAHRKNMGGEETHPNTSQNNEKRDSNGTRKKRMKNTHTHTKQRPSTAAWLHEAKSFDNIKEGQTDASLCRLIAIVKFSTCATWKHSVKYSYLMLMNER